jgi:hypothetical protein
MRDSEIIAAAKAEGWLVDRIVRSGRVQFVFPEQYEVSAAQVPAWIPLMPFREVRYFLVDQVWIAMVDDRLMEHAQPYAHGYMLAVPAANAEGEGRESARAALDRLEWGVEGVEGGGADWMNTDTGDEDPVILIDEVEVLDHEGGAVVVSRPARWVLVAGVLGLTVGIFASTVFMKR